MDTIRVSATDLDQLRYFNNTDDMELSELIARLKHLMPSSEAMEAGTAFHAALETATEGEHQGFRSGDFTFSFETDEELDLPALRELKAERVYRVGETEVTIVGKVDAIHGKRIDDHKFTAKYDPDRYLDSYQWRVYLELFGADAFRWNIFEAIEGAPKNYSIRRIHRLEQHRYPDLAQDVENEIAAFVSFARQHLPEKFQRAA